MKRALLVLCLAALPAPPALAQGINLYWNDCGESAGPVTARTFNCDTNVGDPLTMVVSVFPPLEMPQFVGFEARIDALVNAASLPPWWQLESGQCRAGAVTVTSDPVSFGALSCPDLWDGASAVSISQVTNAPVSWGFSIRLAAAVPTPSPITAEEVGQELVAALVRISRAKTVGAGSCEGCQVGACFVLSQVKLSQPDGVGDLTLDYPATSNWVQLNGGTGNYNCYVPAQNRTWGAIKALYR